MLEYGQAVGQGSQVAGGAGGGGGGGTQDLGAGAADFVNHAVNTISTLPPEALIAIVIVVFLGLIVLRRAF
jgi:hypothetical protein